MTPDEARELWPDVLGELAGAWRDVLAMVQVPPLDLVQMISDRYAAGCQEFSGDWTKRDEAWCVDNAKEELADLVTYLAFRRVLRGSSESPSHQSADSPE